MESKLTENDINILIVDDISINIQLLAKIINQKGYKISYSLDGASAIESAKNIHFDLILLDVMMPIMDGFETCKKIKQLPGYENVPIIFITAKTDVDSIVKGFEVGGVDYITKPFNRSELLSRLETHLKLRKSEQMLKEYNQHLEELLERRTKELINKERSAVFADMIQGIVHNMKTPLMVQLSTADLIDFLMEDLNTQVINNAKKEEILSTISSLKEHLSNIKKGSERLANLINSLLIKGKNDKNNKLEVINLNDLLLNEIEFFQSDSVFKHKIEKEIEISNEEIFVEFISSELSQVIDNLIKNAIDAFWGRNDNFLRISLYKDTDHAYIEIEDNAGGIPENIQSKIFDPFFTTKPTNETKEGSPIGSGIGLHFCKQTIENFGGELHFKVKENIGTTFIIKLKLYVRENET